MLALILIFCIIKINDVIRRSRATPSRLYPVQFLRGNSVIFPPLQAICRFVHEKFSVAMQCGVFFVFLSRLLLPVQRKFRLVFLLHVYRRCSYSFQKDHAVPKEDKVAMKNLLMRALYIAFTLSLSLSLLLVPGQGRAEGLDFLSFTGPEMARFDLAFKQYIASYKVFVEQDKGLAALDRAITDWDDLFARARRDGAGESVLGRMEVVQGMLVQARGLARQHRCEEARELSIPIRSELYELHRGLDMLTAEDYMIYMHNGVFHRAEPLIAQKRYAELEMLVPRIKATLARFETPPSTVRDPEEYQRRYQALAKAVEKYIGTIGRVVTYVDPEYGASMLQRELEQAHTRAHKKFGALYLSFPEGMVWPKKR